MKFSEIFEGWRNDLFPPEKLKETIKAVQEERISICTACEKNSTPGKVTSFSTCRDCGCPLKKKTACLSCSCPLQKWMFETSPTEDTELQNKLNYKNNEEEL